MKKDVLYEIKLLQNEIIRKSFQNKDYQPKSHVQVKIIEYLFKNMNNDVYQKDLEQYLNIRKSTLSGILDTMEKNTILLRVDSLKDARSKKIILTKEAKDQHQEIIAYFKSINNSILEGIPQERLDIFFEVIEMMKKNIINLKEGENNNVKND